MKSLEKKEAKEPEHPCLTCHNPGWTHHKTTFTRRPEGIVDQLWQVDYWACTTAGHLCMTEQLHSVDVDLDDLYANIWV